MRRYLGLLFPLSRLCRRDRQVAGLNIVKTACPSGLSRSDWGLTFPLMPASEESPGWAGHPAVESTDGSNLMNAVTENKPPERVRVKPRGKSSRRRMATYDGDGTRTSKAMYTGTPARAKGCPLFSRG